MAPRENFGGRAAVIMAMAGSAIGLGNIWRFPYVAGENGGGIFVLVYLLCSLFIALPIFLAESVIGRRSRSNCLGAMKTLAPGKKWRLVGALFILIPMVVLSYYSVIGGWSLDYLCRSLMLNFVFTPQDEVNSIFQNFVSNPVTPIITHTVFLGVSCLIVTLGVKSGIEKFSKKALPVLFFLILVLIVFSLFMPGAGEGVKYLLKPDFSKVSFKTFSAALGQSFYSMSLGMGIIITYASYVSRDENLLVSGAATSIADLLFAIMAGLAIMPAVFSAGIEPSAGPGLVFETLPHIFSQMCAQSPVAGTVVAVFFFASLLLAAMTSAVSLIEVGVAFLVEEHKMSRLKSSIVVFLFTWTVGCLCSLSFGPLSGFTIRGQNILGFLDAFTSNVLLTLGGFFCVAFVGWKMKKEDVRDELSNGGTLPMRSFPVIYAFIRYVCPVAVVLIFLSNFL